MILCGYTAYFNTQNNELYIVERTIDENKNKAKLLKIIMHEMTHRFSRTISEGEVIDVFDEAFSDLFPEMCINAYIQKGKELPYISKEEYNKIKENGFKSESGYILEEKILRNLIYTLGIEGKDLDATKQYVFGSKDGFVNVCKDVLGKDIEEVLKTASEAEIKVGKNETEKYIDQIEDEMIQVLSEYYGNRLEHKGQNDNAFVNRNLYQVFPSLVLQATSDAMIKRYCDKKGITIKELTSEDLRKIPQEQGDLMTTVYTKVGHTKFSKELIESWYENVKGNIDEFAEILQLVGTIPEEQLTKILQDKNCDKSLGIKQLCDIYNGFAGKIEGNIRSYSYLLNHCKELDENDKKIMFELARLNSNLSSDVIDLLESFELNDKDEKAIIKYAYKKIKIFELNDVIRILEENHIINKKLDDCSEKEQQQLLELATQISSDINVSEDLKILRDLDRENADSKDITLRKLILDKVDKEKLSHNITKASMLLLLNRFELANDEEIIKNVLTGNFKELEVKYKSDKVPGEEFFKDSKEYTRSLYGLSMERQFNKLQKLVDGSKEMVREYVKGTYGDDALEKVNEILKNTEFHIVKEAPDGKCVAYYHLAEGNIYMVQNTIENTDENIDVVAAMLHEIGHAISANKAITEKDVVYPVEEPFADLFSEMCINYYIQNDKKIPYISEEENKRLKGKKQNIDSGYTKESQILRTILYKLNIKNKDLDAIKSFTFGDKQEFWDEYKNLIGEECFEEIFNEMNEMHPIVQGIYNYKKDLDNIEEKIIECITEQTLKGINVGDNNEEDSLYFASDNNGVLMKIACDVLIKKELMKKEKELNNLTEKDIIEISENVGDVTSIFYEIYGQTNFAKKIIKTWDGITNGQKDKFDLIERITGKIPKKEKEFETIGGERI